MLLSQATPRVAQRWRWRVASSALYGGGHPSLGAMAALHTLRSLDASRSPGIFPTSTRDGMHSAAFQRSAVAFASSARAFSSTRLRSLARLALGHALLLLGRGDAGRRKGGGEDCEDGAAPSLPTERDLVASFADALLPALPCFRLHWRAIARGARVLISQRSGDSGSHKTATDAATKADLETISKQVCLTNALAL